MAGNGTPVSTVDDAPPAFDVGAIVVSAEAFRLTVVGPPPVLPSTGPAVHSPLTN